MRKHKVDYVLVPTSGSTETVCSAKQPMVANTLKVAAVAIKRLLTY
jgi:hypothetical protein